MVKANWCDELQKAIKNWLLRPLTPAEKEYEYDSLSPLFILTLLELIRSLSRTTCAKHALWSTNSRTAASTKASGPMRTSRLVSPRSSNLIKFVTGISKFSGHGKLESPNGSVFEGNFHRGGLQGKAIAQWSDGTCSTSCLGLNVQVRITRASGSSISRTVPACSWLPTGLNTMASGP